MDVPPGPLVVGHWVRGGRRLVVRQRLREVEGGRQAPLNAWRALAMLLPRGPKGGRAAIVLRRRGHRLWRSLEIVGPIQDVATNANKQENNKDSSSHG